MLEAQPAFMTQSKVNKDSTQPLTEARMEELLSAQTNAILGAVDERLKEGFATQEIRILTAVEKRLEKLEERFMKKLNELTNTLDKFLKRLSDLAAC